jgi:hypothetical protein
MRAHIPLLLLFTAAHAAASSPQNAVSREFDFDGITKIILRAGHAKAAVVTRAPGKTVRIRAIPVGGAIGYHPPDPNWKETPPEKWGLDFVAKRHGSTLVISTRKEIDFIHHHYTLEDIHLQLPADIQMARVDRKLSGDGAPDLSKP